VNVEPKPVAANALVIRNVVHEAFQSSFFSGRANPVVEKVVELLRNVHAFAPSVGVAARTWASSWAPISSV
jgi:hypothetical protein